jgi:hypothetical protein
MCLLFTLLLSLAIRVIGAQAVGPGGPVPNYELS